MSRQLYECHGHALMDGADFRAARARHTHGVDAPAVEQFLDALERAGVRYFRDGGDALGVSLYARARAGERGIEYRSPAFAIHKAGRYGSIVGRAWQDLGDYRALIAAARAEGADFIKLMFSGVITFMNYGELSCPGLGAEEICELVSIAHGEGFAVMAHVNGAETVHAAIAAGTDSIEHGYFMDADCLAALAESDCIWVPTVAATHAFIGRAGFNDDAARRTVERQLAMVKLAAARGVRIAAGSDSGAVGVPHGAGTETEYRLLASAGLTEEAIARANRALAARFVRN
ncbi:MAG: Xaa-Pro dipeptidase [Ruminococcaceae bacterium]|nr:Xaa-Pro dipeptidase [Oscillospiraceae bacterium]